MTRKRTLPPSRVRRSRAVRADEGWRCPRGMRSPARRARPAIPPSALITCVARLPSTGGTAIPPSTATYALAPARRLPKRRTLPDRHRTVLPIVSGVAVERWLQVAARDGNSGILLEAQLRAKNRHFERRRVGADCRAAHWQADATRDPWVQTPAHRDAGIPIDLQSWIVVSKPGRRTVMKRATGSYVSVRL